MKRSSLIVIAVALAIVAAGAWFLLRPQHALPLDPLAAVPADAYGIVRIRVDRVLASEAYKRLVVERGGARGIEGVTKTCGFNPLEGIQELVVFARPSPKGGMPRFAFTARGELRHDDLVECVKKVAGGDGVELKREDIEGIPAVQSRKGTSRAAFLGTDGIVGGDSEGVLAAINTLLGKAPSLANDAMLRDLYRQFDQGTDIAVVARMPDELRPIALALAEGILGGQLAILTDARALAGSLSVGQGRIVGGGLLVASSPERAQASVALIRNQIDRLLDIPGVGLTPAASVLRGVQTDVEKDRATVTGQIKVSTAEALLELLPAFEQLRGVLEGSGAPAAAGQTPEPGAAAPAPTATPTPAGSGPTVEQLPVTPEQPAPEAKGKTKRSDRP